MLSLYGNNTYSGGTTLTAGGLAIGSTGALGSGTLTLGGGTLGLASGGQTLGNPIATTSAALAFDTTNGNLTLTGPVVALSGGTGQALYGVYGGNTLTFLNNTVSLGGGLSLYAGNVVFDGANVTDPYDTLRWQNTTGTTAVTLQDNAVVQLSASGSNINSKMGQTAASSASPAFQFLTISSGTLNFASAQLHQLFVADTNYNNSTVNQNGGLVSFTTTAGTDGVELAVTANAVGTYNLNGGVLVTPAVTGGAGTSSFYFSGGTLEANSNNPYFFPNTVSQVSNNNPGGSPTNVFINDGGYSIAISQSLSGLGGLVKSGTGTLTLAGVNIYTGNTTISQGSLAISNETNLGMAGRYRSARARSSSKATSSTRRGASPLPTRPPRSRSQRPLLTATPARSPAREG